MTDRAFEPADPNVFDQAASPAGGKPTIEDLLGPEETSPPQRAAATTPTPTAAPPAAGGTTKPTIEDLLGPETEAPPAPPRRPLTGAVVPGPVGDFIFGNTDHSSLARIMAAFGAGVHEQVGDWGKNLYLSDEAAEALRKHGIFNDYAAGQASLLKANAETLLRSGALVVNGAIYGVPAIWHGLQEAVSEAGEEAEQTAFGHAIGARKLSREIAAVPEAFPTFEFKGGMEHRPVGEAVRHLFPVPAALRAPTDLGVLKDDAQFKGLKDTPVEDVHRELEAPAAEAAPAAETAPPPDVHAMARAAEPKLFEEYDALKRNEALFRSWIEDPEKAPEVAANLPTRLREIEARLSVLEPLKDEAYAKVKKDLPEVPAEAFKPVTRPGIWASEHHDFPVEIVNEPPTPPGPDGKSYQKVLQDGQERWLPAEQIKEAPPKKSPAAPAEPVRGPEAIENPPHQAREGEINAPAPVRPRTLSDQASYMVEESVPDWIAAGYKPFEAEAIARAQAQYYVNRAAAMEGQLGTPEELFNRERADVRAEGIREKVERKAGPAGVRAASAAVDRLNEGKKIAAERRAAGEATGGKAVKAGEAERGMSKEDKDARQAEYEDAMEALEPEERAQVEDGLADLSEEDRAFLLAREEAGLPLFQRRTAPPGPDLFTQREAEGETEPVHTLDITPQLRDAAVEQGFPLFQGTKQGGIVLNPKGVPGRDFLGVAGTRPVLAIMKAANASTAMHELGHQWLADLMRDAEHSEAPERVKADAKAVLDWMGLDKAEDIQRKHHERFANGVLQYLHEGTAPSAALARVFEQFKRWLTSIYKSITDLEKSVPRGHFQLINADVRRVFDRLLGGEDIKKVISAEREEPPGFHEAHEKFAEEAPPHRAHGVAENIQEEQDSIAKEKLLEEENAERLRNIDPETRRREAAGAESAGHADEAVRPGQAGPAAANGAVNAGGGETASPGAAMGAAAGATERGAAAEPGAGAGSANAAAKFADSADPAIDKAGNIRLDKLATAADVDDVIRAAARNNNDFLEERRGVLSDGETLQLADALGMDPAWLDRKKIGDAFNVEEIRAARRLLVQSATDVRNVMIEAKGGDDAAVMKLAETIARHEMIQAKLSGATAEAGRALRAFREVIPGGEQEKNLSDWLKANTGRTLFQLQQMAALGADLKSPAQVSKFVHDTANGKIKQAIVFYYVNALISGPITHARYFVGNALTALWAPLVKTPIAAALDTAAYHAGLQDQRRVFLGEAGQELYALGKGSREGWRAAGEGWRTGQTPNLPGEGAVELFPSQPIAPPIPGVAGTIIGLPGKAVGAIHGFSSAVRYEQEIAKLAYRQAMQERLTGQAFVDRVADLGNNPTAAMTEAASAVARKDLYMAPTEYDSLAGKLTRAANHNVLTKIIVPFMKIGTQITRNALIEATPLGAFDKKVRANLSGANGIEARNTQAASIIAGTGLMGMMVLATAEGYATGDGPNDPRKREVWLLTHHPNSLTIGSISIPYQGLGSLGVLMRLAANAYETHQGWGETDGHSVALDYLHGFEKAVLDESFLRGVKDMIDAIYHYEEYGDRYIANMVTNWMPYSVGLGQVARKIDPYQRETRSKSITDMIWKEAQAKIPWASEGLFPRRDMFGEPIPSAGPVQNYANDPVVRSMDSVHMSVGRLPHKIRGVELTDQQFDDFSRIAGRTAKMMLDRIVKIFGFNRMEPNMRIDLMHKAITKARSEAEKTVMMHATGSDNDIWKKATENKRIKKGITPPH